ncbi:MAG TPA: hypothetical protein VH138_05875 [Vicinamibacterales bacterium]|nr:hypothetical protein [Vicinamibacterales bacterium]
MSWFAALLVAVFAQPPAAPQVTLAVRLGTDHQQFRPGEIIPIELEFNSDIPKRFSVDGGTYDRSGRLTIDEWVIDRIDDVSDPMLDYFASSGAAMGGGIRGIGVLGGTPFTVKLELNDWFRFDKPGTYTLRVRSRRVIDEALRPPAVLPVESNTISFTILPRDAAWEASELETARRIIEAMPGSADSRSGCRMLRFLGTDGAAMEIIRRYGSAQGCEFDFMAGLFGALNRSTVVRAMEEGLRAPDQPITSGYLRTLTLLSLYVQHPEFRPAQTSQTKGRLIQLGELAGRQALIEAAMSNYRDIVMASLPEKTERARAITVAETPASGDQLAKVFLDLPGARQRNLLAYQWHTVAGPAMLPALRQLVNAPATDQESVPDLALRRLAELAPDEARPLLLREIQSPRRGATLATLGVLSDAELPALDDALAANLETRITEIHADLVRRYATRAIEPRVLASAGQRIGRLACRQQAAIIGYLLRVDEGTGAAMLDRAAQSRVTGCWQALLGDVANQHMTPALQQRAIAALAESDPETVIDAVKMLGQHGTTAALPPLRAAFQLWYDAWADRAAELVYSRVADRPNARQAMVEDEFRQAIGAGQGWLMRAEDLRELQSLCVTENCRQQTGYMIQSTDTLIKLWGVDAPDLNVELAQYRFRSLRSLEEMLARYPRGTTFIVERGPNAGADATAAISDLSAFATSHGLSITTR